MSSSPASQPKRALILSYAEVDKDPRVLNQIKWLNENGIRVDTLGRGDAPPGLSGQHYKITRWPLIIRLFAYAFVPNAPRFALLVKSWIPKSIVNGARDGLYDFAVVNTIDLLPWFTANSGSLVKPQPHGSCCLDLHEYSPSQGVGLLWMLLFRRYQNWLITFIASRVFTSRITVAPGIADLYAAGFSMERPLVVRNVPAYVEQQPSSVNDKVIRLIHHGKADSARGLGLMIDAMNQLDDRFTLTLMLVGSPDTIRTLRKQAEPLGSRVVLRDPVRVDKVAEALNPYDLEVIFLPPVTENLRHALPNKFFEAVQGRLGLVIGASPEMAQLVSQFDNGVVVEGWRSEDLARTITTLDARRVEQLKSGSHRAAHDLSAQAEGARFLAALGITDHAR